MHEENFLRNPLRLSVLQDLDLHLINFLSKKCDFLIQNRGKISDAIQVCYQLTQENQRRETAGLLAAMEAFDLKEGFIVTHSQSETLEVKGFKINVVTAWKWILEL